MKTIRDPMIIFRKIPHRQTRVRTPTAEATEGVAEQECEDDRHDEQEHEGFDVTQQLHQIFESNVENTDHSF